MSAAVDIQKFIKSLKEEFQPRAIKAALRAVYKFSWHVLRKAQIYCPVSPTMEYIEGVRKELIKNSAFTGHSGFLKRSAIALDPTEIDALITAEIGFNAKYAAAVHEVLTAFHPTGQAKFLERAMREETPKLVAFVKAEIMKEFEN